MKEKKLELLKKEDIYIGDCILTIEFFKKSKTNKYYYDINYDVLPAITNENYYHESTFCSKNLTEIEQREYTSNFQFEKVIERLVFEQKITFFSEEIDVTKYAISKLRAYHNTRIKDIENKELKELMLSNVNQYYIDAYNNLKNKEREANKERIQNKYNALLSAYKQHGSNKQIKDIEDIDKLLYCEAETIIDAKVKTISKRSTAKNILLSKAYDEAIQGYSVTCEM